MQTAPNLGGLTRGVLGISPRPRMMRLMALMICWRCSLLETCMHDCWSAAACVKQVVNEEQQGGANHPEVCL